MKLQATMLMTLVVLLLTVHNSTGIMGSEPSEYAAQVFDSGYPVSLTAFRGTPILLSSWATWCTECKHVFPSLVHLWNDRQDTGLIVIAVNLDGPGSQRGVRSMIERFGLTMPVWHDRSNAYAVAFQAIGVPTSVLLDAQGRVLKVWSGRVDFDAPAVRDTIKALLNGTLPSRLPGR